MDFVYKEEFWYISTFLNTSFIDGDVKCKELEIKIKERLIRLKEEDIYYKIRDEIGDDILDMA